MMGGDPPAASFPPLFDWRGGGDLDADAVWRALREFGAVQLLLPAAHARLNRRLFALAGAFLEAPAAHRARFAARDLGAPPPSAGVPPPPPTSALVNGYHDAGDPALGRRVGARCARCLRSVRTLHALGAHVACTLQFIAVCPLLDCVHSSLDRVFALCECNESAYRLHT
jgi:hypothetical protein